MAARWQDHILGPDTTANRPAPAAAPVRALYQNTTTGALEYNTGSAWVAYRDAPGDIGDALLDPTTTKGDLIARDATEVVRLAVGTNKQVLAAASAADEGVSWVDLDDSYVDPVPPSDHAASSYTFVLLDKCRLVRISDAGAITATIPPEATVDFPLGTTLQVAQQGAGVITLTGGAGVTVRTPHGDTTTVQYAIAAATKVAADEWYVSGDVE